MSNKQHLITITDRMGAMLFTLQLPEFSNDNFYLIAVSSAMGSWESNEAWFLSFLLLFTCCEDLLKFLRPYFTMKMTGKFISLK